MTTPRQLVDRQRRVVTGLYLILLAGALVALPVRPADAAAFFQGDPFTEPAANPEDPTKIAGYYFGDPTTGNVARWNQEVITYNFTETFTTFYGVAGQGAVNAAFATIGAALGVDTLPGAHRVTIGGGAVQAGDPRIIKNLAYDLQSVALHEISHVLGLHHPNQAQSDPWNRNYNVNDDDEWEQGVLPEGAEPVMWSTMVPHTRTRALTDDDLYALQYLYGTDGDGLEGPVLEGAVNFSFEIADDPDIWIDAAKLAPILGLAWTNGALVDGENYRHLDDGRIWFNIPEPASVIMLGIGGVFLLVWRKRIARTR